TALFRSMQYVRAVERPGVEVMPLFSDAHESVRLERWAPDASISQPAPGGAELLVLSGSFVESGETFEPQSWLRLPPGSTLRATAGAQGCTVWMKMGHLLNAQKAPPPTPDKSG